MLIDLKQLFDLFGEVKKFEHQMDLSDYELFNTFPFISPVQVTGVIENKAGIVMFSANVNFSLKLLCDRCLGEFERDFSYDFEHILITNNSQDSEEYIQLESFNLDLDELILSDILLNLPSKLLCDEDCKGLCSMCGINLNITSCNCKEKTVDPRLAVLGELLK